MTYPKCPKCQGEMEKGYIADFKEGAGAIEGAGAVVSRWVEGEPEKSFWTGVKLRDRKQKEIKTYRCVGCGYLESYALE
jgi:Domain of unknown function (DUF6487)